MKFRLLLLLLAVSAVTARAQTDTTLRFLHTLSRSVNHWVVYPANSNKVSAFGFVYIDPSTGFMFNLEGFLKNDGNNKLTRLPGKIDENTRQAYNLKPGENPTVAVINEDHFYELDIYPRPDWLSSYNDYTDTVAHYVDWARAYNGINDSQMAVDILWDTYHTNSHAYGLEQELGRAYTNLKQYDLAIGVLETGLKANPKDVGLHKELGRAYMSKGLFDMALATFDEGVKLCGPGDVLEKTEMAMNMALIYRTLNKKTAYEHWIEYARAWAPKHSDIADKLDDM